MAVGNRERLEEPRVKRLGALSPFPRVAPGPTPRGMGVERLILLLVAFMSLLTLVSWRYHYGIRNYGRFILEQVLPASGIEDYIRTTFLRDIPKLDDATLANFGNPCFPQYDSSFQNRMCPVGSDYLGIWHYTREILHGKDPYRSKDALIYNENYQTGIPVVVNPRVPNQNLGGLSYFPMGPVWLIPFYLPNYFASLALYLAVLHLFLLALAVWLVRRSGGYRVPVAILMATMFVTSFPLDILVDRGNIEGIAFMFLAAGLIAYRSRAYYLAAVFLGLAASAKLAPGIFFVLFLLDRRFKPLLTAVAVLGGSTLLAMLCMHEPLGTLIWEIRRNFSLLSRSFTIRTDAIRFDHSIYNMCKGLIFLFVGQKKLRRRLARFARFYPPTILVLTGLVLLGLRRTSFTNRVLVLTAMMLAFPTLSGDYKLIHLYLPFGLIFLGVVEKGWATRREVVTCLTLTLLFIPKTYHFPFIGYLGDFGLGFIVNGCSLIALIVLGLTARDGSRSPDDHGLSPLVL